MSVYLPDISAVEALAEAIAPALRNGDILALRGELGAGKTTFARALLRSLGVKGEVPSPTFTLVQSYETPSGLRVNHFDLYRLKTPEELEEIGWHDLLSDGVAVVEWPERAGDWLPAARLDFEFAMAAGSGRNLMADAAAFPFSGKASRINPDFSSRKFLRLAEEGGRSSVLMHDGDAPSFSRFLAIGSMLREAGLSAPEIYKAVPDRGWILMEDFGDRNCGKLLDARANGSDSVYPRAAALLARLHDALPPETAAISGLTVYDAAKFADQAGLFMDHYFPRAKGREATAGEREDFRAGWIETLKPLDALPRSLLLRDFMPDNLMDLPEREGYRSLGIIDFQDAGAGPIAYDIASLCECVRRETAADKLAEAVDAYLAARNSGVDSKTLLSACRAFSAQRHARILGIIGKLSADERHRSKLEWLPRINARLALLAQDEALAAVRRWF